MDLKLTGLTALVTGGTAGIGRSIVETFASEGCNVVFCSRAQQKVDQTLASLASFDVKSSGAVIDVEDAEAFSSWVGTFEKLDIFIPNVSAVSPGWDASLSIDISATVRGIDAVLPLLRASRHAAITYIGSLASSRSTPQAPGYTAAKAAMTHYMKSLSGMLTEEAIRVNTVSPGVTFSDGGF